MRYFFLLLLLIFLCTSGRAQLNVTADLGLKEDFCSATVSDPNTDCINVPVGNNMLTYLPGQDGEILITYRLINNSGKRIIQFLFEDSEYGEVFPVTATNIPNGITIPANFIYPARTTPRTVISTIKLTVEYANGTSETVENTYTIDVVRPTVSVEFGVARQADICDNQPIAPNCNVPYGALNGQTITVGALDTFTTRFAWTNDGLSTFDMENLVDQDNFQIASTGFDQVPGQTLISSRHWEAPANPGTYNYSQTLTVTDFAGNTATRTVRYTIIVEAPQVSVEFGVARQADVCDNTIAPNCNVPYGALNGQTVTVGARDTFTTRFAWTNDGLGEWDMEVLVDQDDFEIANTGFDQEPGQTLISARHWEAPDLPGTYNFSQTLTITDKGGNTATATVTYRVIVQAPMVSVEFGVARQADVCDNQPIAPNCNVPYGAPNGQTVTVGARDTFTTRFAWTNVGLGEWDMEVLVDQDDFEIANTGFDQDPGQTLISARHWEAPDLPGTYNFSQTLTITDQGGNTATATVTYIVIVQAPIVSVQFGVARQADVCDDEPIAPNCPIPYGPLNGQTVTVGARDTFTTRFAWTNDGLGEWDMEVLVDQDDFEIANTGFDQEPGQTLISARHWEAPDLPGTYNFSQTLTITDKGGNTATASVTYRVIVQAPKVSVEFGVANQNDVCPDQPVAPNCPVPYGDLEGQTIVVGAGDTLTTRFAWTNDGLGEWDLLNLVDQDGNQLANTGFDQEPGQTLISSHHLIAPGEPDAYEWSQTLTVTDKGGNVITKTVTFTVKVDCSLSDLAPPTALCRDRTYTIVDGETRTISPTAINNSSFDGCGAIAGGNIDVNSFTCADEGPNTVTLTVTDQAGNSASCTGTVTINVEDAIHQAVARQCNSFSTSVSPGQTWHDLVDGNGKLIAQVLIGNNTNIATVEANVYKSTAMTEETNTLPFLSKRINLELLDRSGNTVQPNNEPVYVRLYYTENELAALTGAAPGSGPATFTIIKTSEPSCNRTYSGTNATEMNTIFKTTGCAGEDAYFEFFTGSFSTFYLFATDAVLPVEMTSFEAREVEKQRVRLDWKTTSETGNSHFQVEHSTDGRSFRVLGAVAGAGDSFTEQTYDFLHETPVAGLNYYRLRQVDFDGTEALSEVREVTITGEASLVVYPNPTVDELYVKGFAGGPVRVLDQQGRIILEQTLPAYAPLEVRALPVGIYVLQAGGRSLRWVKR